MALLPPPQFGPEDENSDTSTEPLVGWEVYTPKKGWNPHLSSDRDEVPVHMGWEIQSQFWSDLNGLRNVFIYHSEDTNQGRSHRFELEYQTPIGKIYVYVPNVDNFQWQQPPDGFNVRLFREIPTPLVLRWEVEEGLMMTANISFASSGREACKLVFFKHERVTFARMSSLADVRCAMSAIVLPHHHS